MLIEIRIIFTSNVTSSELEGFWSYLGDNYKNYSCLTNSLNRDKELNFNEYIKGNIQIYIKEYLKLLKTLKLKINNYHWSLSLLAESDPQSNNYFLNTMLYHQTINFIEDNKSKYKDFTLFIEDTLLATAIISYLKAKKLSHNSKYLNKNLNNKVILFVWLVVGFLKITGKVITQVIENKLITFRAPFNKKKLLQNKQIIIHTFLNNDSLQNDGKLKDHIYKYLPDELDKKHYKFLYFLNTTFYSNKNKLRNWLKITKLAVFFIYDFINLKDLFLSFFFVLKYIFFSVHKARFFNSDVSFLFSLFIKSQVRTTLIYWAYYYFIFTKKLSSIKNSPSIILDIYEGHFWERALRVGKNKYLQEKKIFGINSSAFSENNLSMYSSFDNELPDKIFCKSDYYKNLLIKYGISENKLEVTGSLRYKNLYDYLEKKERNKQFIDEKINIKNIAVVLPLKIQIAEELLLRLVNVFDNTNFNLTLFLHPLNLNNLSAITLPKNFTLTKKPFYQCYKEFDLIICSFTTLAIESFALGIPVLEIERILGVDLSLFDPKINSNNKIKNDIEILDKIKRIETSKFDEKENLEYFKIYFEKLNIERLFSNFI